jgi:hypothetical protein
MTLIGRCPQPVWFVILAKGVVAADNTMRGHLPCQIYQLVISSQMRGGIAALSIGLRRIRLRRWPLRFLYLLQHESLCILSAYGYCTDYC